jgi:hypothetical protein
MFQDDMAEVVPPAKLAQYYASAVSKDVGRLLIVLRQLELGATMVYAQSTRDRVVGKHYQIHAHVTPSTSFKFYGKPH